MIKLLKEYRKEFQDEITEMKESCDYFLSDLQGVLDQLKRDEEIKCVNNLYLLYDYLKTAHKHLKLANAEFFTIPKEENNGGKVDTKSN